MKQRLNLTDPKPVASLRILFDDDSEKQWVGDADQLGADLIELQAHWGKIDDIQGNEAIEGFARKFLALSEVIYVDGEFEIIEAPSLQEALWDHVTCSAAYADACLEAMPADRGDFEDYRGF